MQRLKSLEMKLQLQRADENLDENSIKIFVYIFWSNSNKSIQFNGN